MEVRPPRDQGGQNEPRDAGERALGSGTSRAAASLRARKESTPSSLSNTLNTNPGSTPS